MEDFGLNRYILRTAFRVTTELLGQTLRSGKGKFHAKGQGSLLEKSLRECAMPCIYNDNTTTYEALMKTANMPSPQNRGQDMCVLLYKGPFQINVVLLPCQAGSTVARLWRGLVSDIEFNSVEFNSCSKTKHSTAVL